MTLRGKNESDRAPRGTAMWALLAGRRWRLRGPEVRKREIQRKESRGGEEVTRVRGVRGEEKQRGGGRGETREAFCGSARAIEQGESEDTRWWRREWRTVRMGRESTRHLPEM